MSAIQELLDDYSSKPVPTEKTVSGLHVGLIITGLAITVGAFLTGSKIGGSLGFSGAVKAYVIGSIILTSIACMTGSIGATSRLSTPLIIRCCFGDTGVKIITLVIGITVLGWFAITANLFGETVQKAMQNHFDINLSWRVHVIFGGIIMTATTIFGFKGLDTLSLLTVPVMLVFFVYCAVLSVQQSSWQVVAEAANPTIKSTIGISAVAGGGMVAATLFPDFCRYVPNYRHACLAALTGFGLGYASIMILATIPGLAFGEGDFVTIMVLLEFGIIALLIIIFATWTTNSGNLYSNTLVFSNLFTFVPRWHVTIVLGVLGTALGLFSLLDYLLPFLIFLSIFIPPIAGVYIADFYFFSEKKYRIEKLEENKPINVPGFLAWLLAFCIGYAAANEKLVISTIPSCDSIIAGFLFYTIMKIVAKRAAPYKVSSRASRR